MQNPRESNCEITITLPCLACMCLREFADRQEPSLSTVGPFYPSRPFFLLLIHHLSVAYLATTNLKIPSSKALYSGWFVFCHLFSIISFSRVTSKGGFHGLIDFLISRLPVLFCFFCWDGRRPSEGLVSSSISSFSSSVSR